MQAEQPGPTDLDAVIDELYGLPPTDFTARRDELAAGARKGGDRPLADRIKALRRPSAAAWTVNTFARHRPDEIDRLIALGDRLREAQETLSADQMRELGRQRHQVVAAMAREATRLAADLGHRMSDAVQREVEATLEAALADPAAGRAVQAGRLIRSLEHLGLEVGGLGADDLASAVAGPAAPPAAPSAGPAPHPDAADREAADREAAEREAADREAAEREAADREAAERAQARRRALEDAEREAAEAEQAETDAADALQAAEADARAAQDRLDDADATVRRLETELQEARARADSAADAARRAADATRQARSGAERAIRTAERARGRRDALQEAMAGDG